VAAASWLLGTDTGDVGDWSKCSYSCHWWVFYKESYGSIWSIVYNAHIGQMFWIWRKTKTKGKGNDLLSLLHQ